MLSSYISKRRRNVLMWEIRIHLSSYKSRRIYESVFLTYAPRFVIPFIASAPNGIKFQLIKTSVKQCHDRFRDETLPPERLAYPIAYFSLFCTHFRTMQSVGKHNATTADRLTCRFQNHSVSFRSSEHCSYNLKAFINLWMRIPACNRSDVRGTRIFEQFFRFAFVPRPQYQSFCLNHDEIWLYLSLIKKWVILYVLVHLFQ